MESQAVLIGKRMREIRTVLEITVAEMARVTGVSEEEYLKHESGEIDSSFSFLYHCAERFKVDISTLVEGEAPKLSFYTLTRRNGGMPIRRRHDFEYLHLAAHLKNRQAEPFVVTAPWKGDDQPIALSTHTGQEFDYILSGELKVQLDDKIEIMHPGDSILYDSGHPHGMIAVGGKPCEFLALVIRGEGEAPVAFRPSGSAAVNAVPPEAAETLIYHRFVDEELDDNGNLKNISFHYPANFNYAYDVIDELEKKCPAQRAMVWLSKHHEKREFTFRDIAENSRRVANYLTLLGVKRGDRVMLVLKRHYQYWFTLLALHRIGAIALPVTNQLQAKDFEYRFKAAGVTAVVATADDGVPDHIDAAVEGTSVRTRIIVNGTREGWHDFNAEYVRCGTDFPRPEGQKASDPMLMYFSSGTTGY
ncbi:MAG: AMP-binding protein, partial [Lentisphaeria bacterium]|nr:AMP-binding protein [Lentisphaeria bacterium]